MRYTLVAVLAIGLLFGGIWLGIETGYRAGMEKVCAYQHGTMVLTVKALNEMRNDDTNAISTIHSLGFAASVYVLESCTETMDTNLPSFKALIAYRRSYRTNSTEWTPAEEKLERLLDQVFGKVPAKP